MSADERRPGSGTRAAHRRRANFINANSIKFLGRRRGHPFDGRFASVAMDDSHLFAAVRYLALNPVTARLVAAAQVWPWSSIRAHLSVKDDGLVTVGPVLDRVQRFGDLIEADAEDPAFATLRAAEATGRPLGNADFVASLERRLGRPIARRAPGRKTKDIEDQPRLL